MYIHGPHAHSIFTFYVSGYLVVLSRHRMDISGHIFVLERSTRYQVCCHSRGRICRISVDTSEYTSCPQQKQHRHQHAIQADAQNFCWVHGSSLSTRETNTTIVRWVGGLLASPGRQNRGKTNCRRLPTPYVPPGSALVRQNDQKRSQQHEMEKPKATCNSYSAAMMPARKSYLPSFAEYHASCCCVYHTFTREKISFVATATLTTCIFRRFVASPLLPTRRRSQPSPMRRSHSTHAESWARPGDMYPLQSPWYGCPGDAGCTTARCVASGQNLTETDRHLSPV